jgi:hypothetical protein
VQDKQHRERDDSWCEKTHFIAVNEIQGSIGERFRRFLKSYVHMSGNHFNFEQFCIGRYYILSFIMDLIQEDAVAYLDNDVVLYSNLSREVDIVPDRLFYSTADYKNSASTHLSIWTIERLQKFLNYIDDIYVHRTKLEKIKTHWINYRENFIKKKEKVRGGISDMFALKEFIFDSKLKEDSENLFAFDNSIFDHNNMIKHSEFFTDSFGIPFTIRSYTQLDEEKTQKVKICQIKSLHFQGRKKQVLELC